MEIADIIKPMVLKQLSLIDVIAELRKQGYNLPYLTVRQEYISIKRGL